VADHLRAVPPRGFNDSGPGCDVATASLVVTLTDGRTITYQLSQPPDAARVLIDRQQRDLFLLGTRPVAPDPACETGMPFQMTVAFGWMSVSPENGRSFVTAQIDPPPDV
jgi:hypothetical protein